MQQSHKKIGLATVYRFLGQLEKTGGVHSFICGSQKIYSQSTKNHAHFNCERCGTTQHITITKAPFLAEVTGEVCHFQIDLTGICKKCKEKQRTKEK